MAPNVNFVNVINDLRKNGFSDADIGERVSHKADYIRNIRVGRVRSVRYDVGVRLLNLLHNEHLNHSHRVELTPGE